MSVSHFSNLPPVDPDVKLPSAIRAQAARSDAAQIAAIEQAKAEADPNYVPPAADPEAPPQPTHPTPPAAQDGVKQDEPPPAQDAPKTPADEQSWEHKFNSMKGRWEAAERARKALADDIVGLRNVIATLEMRRPAAQAPLEDVPANLVTDEERAEFGSEFLDVVARRAKEAMAPQLNALQAENRRLQEQLGKVGDVFATNSRQGMLKQLDDNLPGWRTVNTSDDFLEWLSLPDAFSGAIRHDLLKQAFERNDTPRVAAFFKGFTAEQAVVDPATNAQPDQQAPNPGSKVPLNQFVAPGRAKTAAATGAPSEKPSFTRQEISAFYRDVASGKFRGKEAEQKKLEADIFAADREGRIR